ncbi:MAG: response regulator [Byssovorax sp.]
MVRTFTSRDSPPAGKRRSAPRNAGGRPASRASGGAKGARAQKTKKIIQAKRSRAVNAVVPFTALPRRQVRCVISRQPAPGRSALSGSRTMRVLIAEDHPVSHRLLRTMLTAVGHEVVSAHDGDQALAMMMAPDAPYLAILDWQMPGISGVEVCRRVREDRRDRYRYLMLLTSRTEAEHAAEGMDAGADDYLRKPISADELDARIRAGERILALDARRLELAREKTEAVGAAHEARAERIASLDRVAAAAAHEINNPLSCVSNNLEFAQQVLSRFPDQGEVVQVLAEARDGVDRIRRIVEDLKGAGQPGDDAIGSVELSRALETAIKLAETHTRSKARVTMALGDPRRVVGNEGRLAQVFLSLLINAANDIPEGNASQNLIQVRTTASEDGVVVEVEGSGAGMPVDVVSRTHEPFFTTKLSEGLGLGLARSLSILESVGGTLCFDSRPSSSIARVTLTASPAVPEVEAAAPPKSSPTSTAIDVDEPLEVLVIDDEPLVARALTRGLRPHRVTIAQGGREGLALLAGGRRFDLILCDMMMPELTGMDVYEEIARLYPHALPSLAFISGGCFTEQTEAFQASVTVPFLDKPIKLARIRALLHERAHRARTEPEG